ncbi:Uma2 family endonuclease [Spirosoma rhododendri]|uniref:Uma2 family endonuclease n=1 Tax=Spirosoma rhododendri TaxID=2728024 RepID=A0A7L5DV28_9BACT|nr:Uma2 family endonuclease [Spirosoma rhododendri]QJD79807.1 Uma2 family endonuclease [Spirosoma rhododendri]
MIQTTSAALPHTLDQFLDWEPTDGFKYEWNDGELIRFSGMKKKQYYIYDVLNTLFIEKGYYTIGTLMAEPDVMLTTIQMRRPDIAYFTKDQIQAGRNGEDVIPAFVIEVISESDLAYRIEEKIAEYFKAGVQVVWSILPEHEVVYVYTSRKQVTICLDYDFCMASPVLPDFTISVNTLFAPSVPAS